MFVDRKPTKPNRYKITPEGGNPYYVVLERADEPTEEGTPLNAATLNKLIATWHELKDYNGDGVVNRDDIVAFRDLITRGGTSAEDDYNKDGIIDSLDVAEFEKLVSTWGDKVPQPSGASVGQYLRITSVDANGKILTVAAYDDTLISATMEE